MFTVDKKVITFENQSDGQNTPTACHWVAGWKALLIRKHVPAAWLLLIFFFAHIGPHISPQLNPDFATKAGRMLSRMCGRSCPGSYYCLFQHQIRVCEVVCVLAENTLLNPIAQCPNPEPAPEPGSLSYK